LVAIDTPPKQMRQSQTRAEFSPPVDEPDSQAMVAAPQAAGWRVVCCPPLVPSDPILIMNQTHSSAADGPATGTKDDLQATFSRHRAQLASALPPRSIAIVHSSDFVTTNADATFPYTENSDFYYLTGIRQEESTLILFPDAPDPAQRELLFLRETNDTIAVWEGARLSKEQATGKSGIAKVHWNSQFDGMLRRLMIQADQVFLNTNEHPRAKPEAPDRNERFAHSCRERFPLHQYRRLAPLLHRQRAVKNEGELELMRRACEVTDAGFRRLLNFVRPGVREYEVQAELIHEYLRRGSDGFAYPPIIASGVNSCVLHYVSNREVCKDGDLLLLDVAAEWQGYDSDMTRTIPVNGRFSPRQRAVYDAVLRVMRAASGLLQPGVMMQDYQKEVARIMEGELIDLKLLNPDEVGAQDPDKPLYRRYFMHGTSHSIGIDTHDVQREDEPVREGMVFTVEPGIYLPEEGFGVRLENMIIVRSDGNVDMLGQVPVEADEIEALMAAAKQS
jgi:Xaa-Pro aminopeptidase